VTSQLRESVNAERQARASARLTKILASLGVAASSWYRRPSTTESPQRRGPACAPLASSLRQAIIDLSTSNPWYGYKRIAVMCRRVSHPVTDRQTYRVMRDNHLLQQPKVRTAEVHQASKLFELLPEKPNDLWQTDVTFIHIPGYGWRYAVTVIDYYSRYLLACHLTSSYAAIEAVAALKKAQAEAQRLRGQLKQIPFLVTDNGSSFIARRFTNYLQKRFSHVRIAYRTPTQLGLLERFHRTLKEEEVYWRLYDNPAHARTCLAEFRERYNERRPHWALRPATGGDPYVPREVYAEDKAVRIPRWQTWAIEAKQKLDALRGAEANPSSNSPAAGPP